MNILNTVIILCKSTIQHQRGSMSGIRFILGGEGGGRLLHCPKDKIASNSDNMKSVP